MFEKNWVVCFDAECVYYVGKTEFFNSKEIPKKAVKAFFENRKQTNDFVKTL